MRLDELARRAGVASTTIRLYQSKDLLPGPRLVGRTGYYDDAHLARLRLIARLQDDGFSLAGIGRLLDSWQRGLDLAQLVPDPDGGTVFGGPAPVELDPEALAALFPAGAVTPEVMQRAVALGLVELTAGGRLRTADRRFLDTGADLAALGVPAEVILEEWERLVAVTDGVAERFVDLFEAHLLPADWRGLDAEQAVEVLERLRRMRRLATQVVAAAVDASLDRAAARRLSELSPPSRP
jgi:DNA-binding transcriptional MerR regulator